MRRRPVFWIGLTITIYWPIQALKWLIIRYPDPLVHHVRMVFMSTVGVLGTLCGIVLMLAVWEQERRRRV